MTNNTAEHPIDLDPPMTHLTGPGSRLKKKRVGLGLTAADVASRLHLRVCVIEAIENDDYEALPEFVFVKGYLRAYAGLLSIDTDDIINEFQALNLSEPKADKAIWQTTYKGSKRERPFRWLSSIVAICLIALVGTWWHAQKNNSLDGDNNDGAVVAKQDEMSLTPSEKAITTAKLSPPLSAESKENLVNSDENKTNSITTKKV